MLHLQTNVSEELLFHMILGQFFSIVNSTKTPLGKKIA